MQNGQQRIQQTSNTMAQRVGDSKASFVQVDTGAGVSDTPAAHLFSKYEEPETSRRW